MLPGMKLIGIDIEGTFIDLAVFGSDTDELLIHKMHSTPQDPGQGFGELDERAGVAASALNGLVHGTTVTTM